MGSKDAAITLYTNYMCPAAHRVHITLTELNLPYEKEFIDLNIPRTPEYLKINPRGLVPSLSYNGEILTESAIIAQFLVDTYPSHLLPASSDPKGPLARARIAFLVDAWTTRCVEPYVKMCLAVTEEQANEQVDVLVKAVAKDIDPLLEGAAPFFGGSDRLTFAECLLGPFVFRLKAFAEHGIIPAGLFKALQETSPHFGRWSEAVVNHPSVVGSIDVDDLMAQTKERADKIKRSPELVNDITKRAGGRA